MSESEKIRHKGKILVVDDHKGNLQLLISLLSMQGYTVYPASSGVLALRFLESTLPDLILLDVRMPDMSGYQVCERLKANEHTRDIPVIFMTVSTETEDKVHGFKLGAVDYIVKPFEVEEVLARVGTHLTMHQMHRQLAAQNQRLHQVIAEHKQTELALRESEARLRALIDNLPFEFWSKDSELRYTMQNAASIKKYGNLVGKRVEELDIPAAIKSEWVEEDLQVLEGKILRGEHESETADGKRVYENIVAPIRVDDSVVGIVGVTLDVTERKHAEQELAQERYLMRALMSTVPILIYFKDTESRFLRINQAWAKWHGLNTPDEAVGKTDFDFMSVEEARQRFEDEQAIIKSGKPILNKEEVLREPGGNIEWSYTNKFPLRDKEGCIIGTFGFTQRITERKQAEMALHESEARYKSLFENSPISLWEEDFSGVKQYLDTWRAAGVTDFRNYFENHPEEVARCAAQVKILDVNKATLNLLGIRDKSQALGGLGRLLADEALASFGQELITLAEGGRHFEGEEIHRMFNGETRFVSLQLSIVPGAENSWNRVLVSILDVTEHTRAEMALQESEERLRTLINAMPDLVVFKDGEGRYLESNNYHLRFFQLENVDYRGKTDAELAELSRLYRAALATAEKTDEAAWLARTARRSDEILPQPDGQTRIFDLIKVPTFYPDGRRKGLVVVGRDITERKHAEDVLRKAHAELEQRVEQRTEEIIRANARLKEQISERTRAQEALKQSELKFRSIVERSQDGITLTDEQGIIIGWNESQERITGRKRAQVIGRPIWDVQFEVMLDEEKAIPGTYDRIKAEAMELHTTGKASWLNALQENEIQLPDRMQRIVQLRSFAIETDRGVMRASITRDVTNRGRAEQALRESEEKYRAIVESFDGLIYICSRDYRVELMNQRFIERTGHVAVGELCYQALHDRDSICPWCVNAQVWNGETVRWQVHSPKDNRWYHVVDTPIYHADGSMSKQAIITDITERVEMEQALKESEAKYRSIFEHSGVALMFIEEDGTIALLNKEAEKLSGYSIAEVEGKRKWFDFVASKDDLTRMQEYHRLRRLDPAAVPQEYKFRFVDKAGRQNDVAVAVTMIPNSKQSLAIFWRIDRKQK